MNKKYLILGIVLIMAVGLTNMARANSFNDALNKLSNQLYWLRDNLTAQVKLQPAPYPYPAISGFADTKPVTVRPAVEYYMQTCQKDSDCGIVNTDCCTCYNGGSNESMRSINRSYGESFMKNMTSYCGHVGMKCSGKNQCSQDAKLHSVACESSIYSGGVSIKKCVVRYSGSFVKATNSLPPDTAKQMRYICDATKQSCALVDSSQHLGSRMYITLDECKNACQGAATKTPIISPEMTKCKADLDCAMIYTSPCGCGSGGSLEAILAINKSYFKEACNKMSSEWYKDQSRPPLCLAVMACKEKDVPTGVKCNNSTCEVVRKWYSSTPYTANFYNFDMKGWEGIIKAIEESDCRVNPLTSTTTKPKLWYVCDHIKKTCSLSDLQGAYSQPYNTLEACKNACQGTTTTTTSTSTTTSTTTTTTTQPQAVDQWYKLTEYQGCKMDDWTKTCVDTNAAKNSGNAYKYCMNQYLLSQKITFTDLTVKNMPGPIICMACGCEMPDIYIKAKTSFESQLNKIGFTKSSDPEAKAEEQAKDNKLPMDLSHQGLYFKEDRDTSKINYAIISKNDKVTCGDNVCHPRENYLYQIDLSKHCSALADKIINFDHCPQDCKNTFDTTKAVTKDEFNALEFSCKNQPKTESTVITPKPVEQMTQTEKNNLIMQLQQQLLTLLVYLKDLLLAQR